MKKKVVGYKYDGTEIYEQKGIGNMSILYCEGCKSIISKSGGREDVYCPNCANKRGLVKANNRK